MMSRYQAVAVKDEEQWGGFFNWYPVVTRAGETVWEGASVYGTGPRLWALWKAWRAKRLLERGKPAPSRQGP